MAVHRFVSPEENLIDKVVDQDELLRRIPRLSDFYEGVAQMRSLQEEISTLGSFTKKTGFTPGKDFQPIATIPYSVAAAMVMVDPGFFKDRKKVYRFLAQHPEYDTRTT